VKNGLRRNRACRIAMFEGLELGGRELLLVGLQRRKHAGRAGGGDRSNRGGPAGGKQG
jgi:hypothetical protein